MKGQCPTPLAARERNLEAMNSERPVADPTTLAGAASGPQLLDELRREAAWCYTCRWEAAAAAAVEPVELAPEDHTSACAAWREAAAALGFAVAAGQGSGHPGRDGLDQGPRRAGRRRASQT